MQTFTRKITPEFTILELERHNLLTNNLIHSSISCYYIFPKPKRFFIETPVSIDM
jgi:hypothetical protein